MKTAQRLFRMAIWTTLVLAATMVGCNDQRADTPAQPAGDTGEQQYGIKGRVVAVDPDGRSVTLDHEEIPGLMKGMEMKFAVENPAILQRVEAGDQAQGRLIVKNGNYVITELEKSAP